MKPKETAGRLLNSAPQISVVTELKVFTGLKPEFYRTPNIK